MLLALAARRVAMGSWIDGRWLVLVLLAAGGYCYLP